VIRFLANDAFLNSHQLQVESSGVAIDNGKVLNLAGGPLHLDWKGSGSARDIVYINKSKPLEFDFAVVERADRLLTHSVEILSGPYGGALTSHLATANFNEPLMGPEGYTFVHDFGSLLSDESVMLRTGNGSGGAFDLRLNNVFFSSSITFGEIINIEREPVTRFQRFQRDKIYTDVIESITINIRCATDEIMAQTDNVHRLFKQPFYIYDDQPILERRLFAEKVLYCVLSNFRFEKVADKLNRLNLELFRVRSYSNP